MGNRQEEIIQTEVKYKDIKYPSEITKLQR